MIIIWNETEHFIYIYKNRVDDRVHVDMNGITSTQFHHNSCTHNNTYSSTHTHTIPHEMKASADYFIISVHKIILWNGAVFVINNRFNIKEHQYQLISIFLSVSLSLSLNSHFNWRGCSFQNIYMVYERLFHLSFELFWWERLSVYIYVDSKHHDCIEKCTY